MLSEDLNQSLPNAGHKLVEVWTGLLLHNYYSQHTPTKFQQPVAEIWLSADPPKGLLTFVACLNLSFCRQGSDWQADW